MQKKWEMEKTTIWQQPVNNCGRYVSWVDAESGMWKYDGKQESYSLKVSPPKAFISDKEKTITQQWRSLADTTLSGQVNITRNEKQRHPVALDRTHREGRSIPSVGFLPKIHSLNWVMSNYQTSPGRGTFYRITSQILFPSIKFVKLKKKRKEKD